MEVRGPFYKATEAAAYCGYASADSFRRVCKDYCLPKCGPKNNRFARSVLDAFMENPDAFKYEQPAPARRRKPKLVTVGA